MKIFRKSALALVIMLAVIFSIGLTACKKYAGLIEHIFVIAELGEYSGNRVELWELKYKYEEVADVPVPLYIGDTLICTFPDASYKIVVITEQGNYDIKYAYEKNYINPWDLSEISEKAQQAFADYDVPPEEAPAVEGLTAEQVLGIRNAYFNSLYNAAPEDIKNIEILYYLGTYSYNEIFVILRYIPEGHGVADVEVPVYVHDTYVCTFPDPSYKIVTCPSYYAKCTYLQTAYDGGYITDEDLAAIAERAQRALGEISE